VKNSARILKLRRLASVCNYLRVLETRIVVTHMEAAGSFETSITVSETIRRHIPEDLSLLIILIENFRSKF
jgi:hypothetical protein